jgi:hypothetical protein
MFGVELLSSLPLPPLRRDKTFLRLKFLYIMGGTLAGGGVIAAEVKASPTGETITVPAGPLHGVIAVVVAVQPAKNVLRVELFCDGSQIGSDALSPYAFVWDTRTVSDGTHLLRADSIYNNRKHSGTLSVTVKNASTPTTIYPSNTLYPSETAP